MLIEDFADGFYIGMQLSQDDWKPLFAQPEIGIAMACRPDSLSYIGSHDASEIVADLPKQV